MQKRWSDESLIDAVKTSYTMSTVLEKLGMKKNSSGNYTTVKHHIKRLGIDTSHFLGRGYLKGKTHNWSKTKPLNEILIENSQYIHTSNLKKRLLKEGIFERKCYCCNRTEWMGKPIPIEIEHKDGDRYNNRIENLTLLCPNCHSFTLTYRGKNKKLNRLKMFELHPELVSKSERYCKDCNAKITQSKSGYCAKCVKKHMLRKHIDREYMPKARTVTSYLLECAQCKKEFRSPHHKQKFCSYKCLHNSQRKAEPPSKDELESSMREMSWTALGIKFNVTDNAVKKWARQYGIEFKTRPYHKNVIAENQPTVVKQGEKANVIQIEL